ncbi:hypothetical protein NL676_038194 [Syzygium grande]|nr:hypothetical protein NL676_038194 [Syzygium grande]
MIARPPLLAIRQSVYNHPDPSRNVSSENRKNTAPTSQAMSAVSPRSAARALALLILLLCTGTGRVEGKGKGNHHGPPVPPVPTLATLATCTGCAVPPRLRPQVGQVQLQVR